MESKFHKLPRENKCLILILFQILNQIFVLNFETNKLNVYFKILSINNFYMSIYICIIEVINSQNICM